MRIIFVLVLTILENQAAIASDYFTFLGQGLADTVSQWLPQKVHEYTQCRYFDFFSSAIETEESGNDISADESQYPTHLPPFLKPESCGIESGDTDRIKEEFIVPEWKHQKKHYKIYRQYQPTTYVRAEGKTFYFSDIFSGDHPIAVMYVIENKNLLARLLYKSNSDGGWRVSPGILTDGHLLKGGNVRKCHYTQSTKLHEDILIHFESKKIKTSPNDSRNLRHLFVLDNNRANTFDCHVTLAQEKILDTKIISCPPGSGFNKTAPHPYTNYSEYLADISYPDGFIPDFNKNPVKKYTLQHTLLGETYTEVYESVLNEQIIEWHMARDKENRIWIDRIRYKQGNISSYGVSVRILNSGLLTNKPIEYRHQIQCLKEEERNYVNETYSDITPLLGKLLPIQRYRAARIADAS